MGRQNRRQRRGFLRIALAHGTPLLLLGPAAADLVGNGVQVAALGADVGAVPCDVAGCRMAEDVGELPLAYTGFQAFNREGMAHAIRTEASADAGSSREAPEQLLENRFPPGVAAAVREDGPRRGPAEATVGKREKAQ